jgi:hypothetical protein
MAFGLAWLESYSASSTRFFPFLLLFSFLFFIIKPCLLQSTKRSYTISKEQAKTRRALIVVHPTHSGLVFPMVFLFVWIVLVFIVPLEFISGWLNY